MNRTRREFLVTSGAVAAAAAAAAMRPLSAIAAIGSGRAEFDAALAGGGAGAFAKAGAGTSRSADSSHSTDKAREKAGGDAGEGHEPKISLPEDLMREHGVLDRILLVYEEGARRLRQKEDVPHHVFQNAAQLVRIFVEDYHEQTEETLVFPEFARHARLVELVKVLTDQHAAGRRLTDVILRSSDAEAYGKVESREDLLMSIDAFVRMYRPHKSYEDTILFPALYTILPERQVAELGEKSEQSEHERLGAGGFEHTVTQVAAIERELELDDLSKFTPRE